MIERRHFDAALERIEQWDREIRPELTGDQAQGVRQILAGSGIEYAAAADVLERLGEAEGWEGAEANAFLKGLILGAVAERMVERPPSP